MQLFFDSEGEFGNPSQVRSNDWTNPNKGMDQVFIYPYGINADMCIYMCV